jgi:hypothetical protein
MQPIVPEQILTMSHCLLHLARGRGGDSDWRTYERLDEGFVGGCIAVDID